MNCKYCGIELTEDNKYSTVVCNNKQCIWQQLKVCCEDCFNCLYHDCIVESRDISEGVWNVEELEKKAG